MAEYDKSLEDVVYNGRDKYYGRQFITMGEARKIALRAMKDADKAWKKAVETEAEFHRALIPYLDDLL